VETKGKLILSPSLAARLMVPPGQPSIRVRVGAIVVNAELVVGNGKRSSYILSPELRKALYINKRKSLLIRYQPEDHMIHFGPTIGVLASGLPNRPQCDPKSLQAELIMLTQVGRKIPGQVYVLPRAPLIGTDQPFGDAITSPLKTGKATGLQEYIRCRTWYTIGSVHESARAGKKPSI